MTIYKGYVPTRNKKCLSKFKDRPLASLEDVKGLDEYAGILADDVICIDIDDHDQSEKLMDIVEDLQINCQVMQTTRGRHFYFHNTGVDKCYTGTKLAIGLTADIKVGSHNSYAVVKFKGKERFIEWEAQGDSLAELPKWLLPVKTDLDLMNMEEGEGRNQALYNYILTLSRYGFSKDDSKETLRLVNKWIFRKPLKDRELNQILRDDAFPKNTFMTSKGFEHDKFGQFLINEYSIQRINGILYSYSNGIYERGAVERKMITHMPSIKAQQRSEVMKYLNLVAPETKSAEARYIAFNNGVFDVVTQTLIPFSKDIVVTNRIPWDWNPDAYDELADRTLDRIACGDPQVRTVLEECIGYPMWRRQELSKFILLVGDKANGKSTFLDMVKTMLGSENVSYLDLGELNERFSVAELAGRLANVGDDISDEFLQGKGVSILKKIVSGNSIKAEFKGQDVFFFSPYAKLLFSANEIPRTKDKTGAVLRRMVIVPFNARFTKDDADYDPYITEKLCTKSAMEYIIQLGMKGIERILLNKDFSPCDKVAKAVEEYNLSNNPVMQWLGEVNPDEDILNHPTNDVHKAYKIFCIENNYTEMSLISFSRVICQRLSMVTQQMRVGGRRQSIFVYDSQSQTHLRQGELLEGQ